MIFYVTLRGYLALCLNLYFGVFSLVLLKCGGPVDQKPVTVTAILNKPSTIKTEMIPTSITTTAAVQSTNLPHLHCIGTSQFFR